MAVVLLKNAIGRRWKQVGMEEKSQFKAALIVDDCEVHRRISSQMDLVIAKIARTDWPREWTGLIPNLVSRASIGVSNVESLIRRRRSIQTVLAVLKELNTKRLGGDRLLFRDLAKELIGGFLQMWIWNTREILIGSNQVVTMHYQFCDAAEIMFLTSKILHLLLIEGWAPDEFATNPHTLLFLDSIQQNNVHEVLIRISNEMLTWPWVEDFQNSCTDMPEPYPLRKSVVKSARYTLKTVVEMQKSMSIAFVPYLSTFLPKMYDSGLGYIQNLNTLVHKSEAICDEKLGVLIYTFLSNIIDCPDYDASAPVKRDIVITSQGSLTVDAQATMRLEEAQVFVAEFFNHERTTELVYAIALRGLALTESNIEEWQDSPEEYAFKEEELAASIRAACENLLTCLVNRYDFVPAIMATLLSQSEAGNLPYEQFKIENAYPELGISPLMVLKEAIYSSIGLCAYWLHGRVNFRSLMENNVFPILRDTSNTCSDLEILRKRMLWLIGCVTIEIDKDLYVPLYDLLLGLIEGTGSNLAIRLGAAKALHGLIDSWEFVLEGFLPFLNRSVRALMTLSENCETCTGRLNVTQNVLKVVERSKNHVASFIEDLIRPLNVLWGQCGDDSQWSLWKIAAMELLEKVVDAVGESTLLQDDGKARLIEELQNMLVPLVQVSSDPNCTDFVYLGEPAANILRGILQHTACYSRGLHELFPRLSVIMKGNESTMFPCVLDSIESYMFFAPHEILCDYGESVLLPFLAEYVMNDSLKVREEARIIRCIEIIVMSKSDRVLPIFHGMFSKMAIICTNKKANDSRLVIGYLSVLARLLSEFGTIGLTSVIDPHTTIVKLVDSWIDHFDSIGGTEVGGCRKTIWAVVLIALVGDVLADSSSLLNGRLLAILHIGIDALSEVKMSETIPVVENVSRRHRRQEATSSTTMIGILKSSVDKSRQKLDPSAFNALFHAPDVQSALQAFN